MVATPWQIIAEIRKFRKKDMLSIQKYTQNIKKKRIHIKPFVGEKIVIPLINPNISIPMKPTESV